MQTRKVMKYSNVGRTRLETLNDRINTNNKQTTVIIDGNILANNNKCDIECKSTRLNCIVMNKMIAQPSSKMMVDIDSYRRKRRPKQPLLWSDSSIKQQQRQRPRIIEAMSSGDDHLPICFQPSLKVINKMNASLISLMISSIFLLNPSIVHCDIFSSTASIQSLMHLERHLVTSLTSYLDNLEEKTNQIKLYLTEFAYSAGQKRFAGTYADDIMDNPLQAFQLVKRLTVNWNKIVKVVQNDKEWNKVQQLMSRYSMLLPKQEDLNGAALALVRLQDTYNLSLSDLANGFILGQDSFIRMSARDCLYLGKNAFNNGYYGHSLEWFDEAVVRAFQEGNQTASVDEIVPFYQLAIEYIDRLDNELREQNYPRHSEKLRVVEGDNEEYQRYQMLCRGEDVPVNKTIQRRRIKDQRCYYSTNNGHPLLILMPLKVELYSSDPFIAMYYDLINQNEIDIIKELSMPMLTRARVLTDEKDNEISQVRVSQTAWFTEASHPLIGKINRRIETVTGLSVNMNQSDCELVQIANYGIGGHYVPHYDYLIKDKPEHERHNVSEKERFAGDRIATFMFYLSDVIKGGSTVFTRLGVRVNPVKGAAIFWYNLYQNGEGILDTIHGACPVLIGEKWVANYWIRENGQLFNRPCSLDASK